MNIQTFIVIVIIAVFVVMAIRYLVVNNDHCAGCGSKCTGSCPHCKG